MKFLGRFFLLLVFLIVGAVVALSFVDLGRFAPQIEAAAKQATGRTLKIDGPLHIGLSLSPSLVAEEVSFSNASWGTRPQMLTADKLSLQLDILPLLSGKVALKSVKLINADVLVETNKQGVGNWVFDTSGAAKPASGASSGGGASLEGLPDVEMRDLKVAYRDGATGKTTEAAFQDVTVVPQGRGVHAVVAGDVNGAKVAFASDINQSADNISLKNASLSVGDTSVTGDIDVSLSGTPSVTGTLSSDTLDLTPFASGGGSGGKKSGPVFSRDPLPLDQLAAANADLTLKVGSLTYGKVVLKDFEIPIKLKGGVLNVPARMAYRGVPINLDVTGNGAQKRLGLDLKTSGLDIGKLFADLDVTNLLVAKADIAVKLSGSGGSLHAIAASTGGQTNVVIGKGSINSKAFAIVSDDLVNAIIPSGQNSNTAQLVCALSRFDFQNGVGTSKALAVETDSLVTTGGGTVNLGTEHIDLLLKPKPKKASVASLAFPIRLSGPLNAPTAGIDRTGAALGVATAVGGVALTGGIGELLPLMSTGSSADTGGCAGLAAAAASDKGVVGTVSGAGESAVEGVGSAVDSVTKGIGDLFK
ncbi:MAG: AsmA family protein [Parvibaculum sp.]